MLHRYHLIVFSCKIISKIFCKSNLGKHNVFIYTFPHKCTFWENKTNKIVSTCHEIQLFASPKQFILWYKKRCSQHRCYNNCFLSFLHFSLGAYKTFYKLSSSVTIELSMVIFSNWLTSSDEMKKEWEKQRNIENFRCTFIVNHFTNVKRFRCWSCLKVAAKIPVKNVHIEIDNFGMSNTMSSLRTYI